MEDFLYYLESGRPEKKLRGETMVLKLKETRKAAALFEGWQETMIWSCLQGVMGSIYADSQENPVSAVAENQRRNLLCMNRNKTG